MAHSRRLDHVFEATNGDSSVSRHVVDVGEFDQGKREAPVFWFGALREICPSSRAN
jgi:hypothetical protein